jgi:biopolymer transport protein ExbD
MAFSTGGSGKKHAVLSDINITPMVDVMLVLLVIFIMAAPLMTQSVKVKAANSKAASNQAKTPPVVLAVNAQGQYFVGTTVVKEAELLATLKALAEKDAQTTILIRADKNIPYSKVAQLLLASQGAGLEKVSIDTQATGQ